MNMTTSERAANVATRGFASIIKNRAATAWHRTWRFAIPCLALLASLSAVVPASAAETDLVSSVPVLVAQVNVPSVRLPGGAAPVAPPAAPVATDTSTENAKLAGIKGHCFCDVTCTSSKGQTFSPGQATLGGTLWQHLANNRQECQNRCQAHINANIQAWAAQGKMCDSVTCRGTSWVGTNSERRASQHSINRSGTPDCPPTPSGGSTCCPPMGHSLVKDLFGITGHPTGNGGQALYKTSGPEHTSFVQGYQAYLALLKFTCPKVDRLNVQFTLHTASGIGGTLSATPLSTFTVSFPSGTVTPSMPQFAHILQTNQVYGIQATTVGVDARGNPVDCGFEKQCNAGDRFTFAWSVGSRLANPDAGLGK